MMISSRRATAEIFHMQLVIICRTIKGISGLILIQSLSVPRTTIIACVEDLIHIASYHFDQSAVGQLIGGATHALIGDQALNS